jgi:hypothetical protein
LQRQPFYRHREIFVVHFISGEVALTSQAASCLRPQHLISAYRRWSCRRSGEALLGVVCPSWPAFRCSRWARRYVPGGYRMRRATAAIPIVAGRREPNAHHVATRITVTVRAFSRARARESPSPSESLEAARSKVLPTSVLFTVAEWRASATQPRAGGTGLAAQYLRSKIPAGRDSHLVPFTMIRLSGPPSRVSSTAGKRGQAYGDIPPSF